MANYTYGLIDWDLFMMNTQAMFNIDLMKVSTYLKKQGKFVKLITTLDPSLLDYYNTVYIFKNVDDGYYPADFFSAPNVEVFGAVAGGGHSMLSEEMEQSAPDMYIYLKAKKFFNRSDEDKKRFEKLNEAVHLRVSHDGKNVTNNWLKPLLDIPVPMGMGGQTLHIHDPFITDIPDGWDAINRAADQENRISPHELWFKYPLICYTDDEFLAWRSFKKNNITQIYELNFVPDTETLFRSVRMKTTPSYKKQYKHGGENSVIYINIPWNYNANDFIKNLYYWYLFSLYGRRRLTSIQIRLPQSTYLPHDWTVFVEMLNDFWLFNDIELGNYNQPRGRTFEKHVRDHYKASRFLKEYYADYDYKAIGRVFDWLNTNYYDFFIALDDFRYLEYDTSKEQWVAIGGQYGSRTKRNED